jgi:hypothetical protein
MRLTLDQINDGFPCIFCQNTIKQYHETVVGIVWRCYPCKICLYTNDVYNRNSNQPRTIFQISFDIKKPNFMYRILLNHDANVTYVCKIEQPNTYYYQSYYWDRPFPSITLKFLPKNLTPQNVEYKLDTLLTFG